MLHELCLTRKSESNNYTVWNKLLRNENLNPTDCFKYFCTINKSLKSWNMCNHDVLKTYFPININSYYSILNILDFKRNKCACTIEKCYMYLVVKKINDGHLTLWITSITSSSLSLEFKCDCIRFFLFTFHVLQGFIRVVIIELKLCRKICKSTYLLKNKIYKCFPKLEVKCLEPL